MKPDARIVKRIQKIDRDLSVEWVQTARGPRWAVFHGLQMPGRYEESIDLVARDLQLQSLKLGYMLDFTECAMAARETIHAGKLVCYVTEPDGCFAPLDGRIVEKLKRMDYFRQNFGLRDWREMLNARSDATRDSQTRATNDVWDTINRDPVFKRQMSDILWGLRPARSVTVPSNFTGVTHAPALRHP